MFIFSKAPRFHFGWKPPFSRKTFMQERLWKSRCFKCKICSMTSAANIAVEQGVIVATIMIAFLYLHASDVHQHSFNRSLVATWPTQSTQSTQSVTNAVFDQRSLHKVWKWLSVCVNEATIDFHHVSAVKLRNTSRRNITQRWVSWFIPVVPEVSVETQTRATKGKKTDRAEAIQTEVLYFQRYRCTSLSVV